MLLFLYVSRAPCVQEPKENRFGDKGSSMFNALHWNRHEQEIENFLWKWKVEILL